MRDKFISFSDFHRSCELNNQYKLYPEYISFADLSEILNENLPWIFIHPTVKMAKKCIVPNCKSNYRCKNGAPVSREKTAVFRFPANPEELKTWLRSMPFKNLKINRDSVICEKHWPPLFPKISKKGKLRPSDPPSVWPDVPPSCVPSAHPPPRPTKRTSLEVRGSHRTS